MVFSNYLVFPSNLQPILCSNINKKLNVKMVLCIHHIPIKGSIICHLGEAHLGFKAKGKIVECLEF